MLITDYHDFILFKVHAFLVTMSKAFVTQPAPDFDVEALLPSEEFENVKLADYKSKGLSNLLVTSEPYN